MKAIILAAGEASRLQPYSDIFPKLMFPVGGRPIGAHIVWNLVGYGIKNITICVNERWESYVRDYFNGLENLMKIGYSSVGIGVWPSKGQLGTAMEVKNIRPELKEDFLIYYGDVLTSVRLDSLLNKHYERCNVYGDKYMGTLVVQDKINTEVGLLKINDETISSFQEKVQIPQYSWSAIAVLKSNVMKFINKKNNDFGHHVFPKLIEKGFILKSFINDREWHDVGNLQSYKKVRKIYEGYS
jgi:NDP-sugar pyrophosphorylase family protein